MDKTVANHITRSKQARPYRQKLSDDVFLDLYFKGYTDKEIAEKCGVKKVTVWKRRKIFNLPPNKKKRFIPIPSPELAYILGVLDGDGWVRIKKKHHIIALSSIDLEFVRKFNESLTKLLNKNKPYSIQIVKPKGKNRKIQHKVEGICKDFLEWYYSKSCIKEKHHCIKKYPYDYLKGLYDSEGSIVIDISHGNAPYLYCRIFLFNTNLELLKYIKRLLEKLGFHPRLNKVKSKSKISRFPDYSTIRKKDEYYIALNRKEDIYRFHDKIGFTIDRKQKKLEKWVSLTTTIGTGIRSIKIWAQSDEKILRKLKNLGGELSD